RKAKKNRLSKLGGPTESQYYYQYFVCIWRRHDGYVIGGIGEWLANFICKIIRDHSLDSSNYVCASTIAADLVAATCLLSKFSFEFDRSFIIPIDSLKNIFKVDYEYVYIVTFEEFGKFCDKSIMLSVYEHVVYQTGDYILTARPNKFLAKYKYYKTQMESGKSFAEINYGDDEVEKEGYLLEDQLLVDYLKTPGYDILNTDDEEEEYDEDEEVEENKVDENSQEGKND